MQRRITLSIAVTGDEPPTEFRIFTAGVVDTTKGQFLFDDQAAASVMAEYEKHGIDLMVDYDHASLSSFALDPATAGKAAGWFNLEVRNGELWAVNVRWTPPAATALRSKEWRFMSPAFQTDESGRVIGLLNVAITNMPATRNLQPLMAASKTTLGAAMDPKLVQQALDALIAGDEAQCAEILKGVIAKAAGAEADPDAKTEDAPPPAGDGGADEAQEMAAAPAAPDAKDDEDKPAEVAAALSRVMRLSAKKSLVEALSDIEVWHASHVKLETETQKLAAERATLEAAERRRGCAELVTLAGRAPSTVWADDSATTPKKYLASMPIDDFRAYVADAVKASGKRGAVQAPKTATLSDGSKEFMTSNGVVTLSASELRECERAGAKPEIYAENKAIRAARAGSKGSAK